jgi:hypothetical protein
LSIIWEGPTQRAFKKLISLEEPTKKPSIKGKFLLKPTTASKAIF